MSVLPDNQLYGILDLAYVTPEKAPAMAEQMLSGGVTILQLRAKSHSPENILTLAKSIAPICRAHGVPFILNDHPDLVHPSGADGVHVGQEDLPVAHVRAIIGSDRIIGLSTHSIEQALDAVGVHPDYIGFGPLFATPTKPDYPPIGTADIAAVHRQVPLPIFCIGGIKLNNLPDVLSAGARRVVIVSGILLAPDPEAYCRNCLDLLSAAAPA